MSGWIGRLLLLGGWRRVSFRFRRIDKLRHLVCDARRFICANGEIFESIVS